MKPKLKIPATRVLSDECVIVIGRVIEDEQITEEGIEYFVHKGEWVEVMPVMTVKEVMNLSSLQRASEDSSILGNSLSQLCVELSHRVVAWNWTNMMGEPLEQPYDRPDVLESLSADELLWLINATGVQEMAEERKKDSTVSDSTS